MTCIKAIDLICVISATLSGFVAAGLWLYASGPLKIGDSVLPQTVDPDIFNTISIGDLSGRLGALLIAAQQSARVNRHAAIWTAASVALGGTASLLGFF